MLTTIDAFKEYLGDLANNKDDVLLTRIVTAASSAINAYCQRTFEQTTYTSEMYDGTGTDVLVLRNYPIITISALLEGGSALTTGTDPYGAASADVYINYDEGELIRPFSKFFEFRKYYRVTYSAGYATIPASIEQACLDLSALVAREKEHPGLQSKNTGVQASVYIRRLPDFSQQALDSYRQASIGRLW